MLPLFIKTLIIYLLLVVAIKLTGKRQVGEMQLSELVTAFLVSEVAATPLADPDVPLIFAVIPVLALICIEIIISFATVKSPVLKKLFDSPPAALVKNGKIDIAAMSKQRITADELLSSLRLKDISDISKVSVCFLEHNGQISAFEEGENITFPLIIDGKVNTHYLSMIGRDIGWLKSRLRHDCKDMKSIFLMTSDGKDINYCMKEKSK